MSFLYVLLDIIQSYIYMYPYMLIFDKSIHTPCLICFSALL